MTKTSSPQFQHPLQSLSAPIPMVTVDRLRPGDPMWRSLDGMPLLTHYGCFAGFDYLGRPWVFEHTKGHNSRLVPFEVFAKGYQVYFQPLPDHARPAAIIRMRGLLANPRVYDKLQFNCEHAKNYITTGRAHSPQTVLVAGALAFGIYALVSSNATA